MKRRISAKRDVLAVEMISLLIKFGLFKGTNVLAGGKKYSYAGQSERSHAFHEIRGIRTEEDDGQEMESGEGDRRVLFSVEMGTALWRLWHEDVYEPDFLIYPAMPMPFEKESEEELWKRMVSEYEENAPEHVRAYYQKRRYGMAGRGDEDMEMDFDPRPVWDPAEFDSYEEFQELTQWSGVDVDDPRELQDAVEDGAIDLWDQMEEGYEAEVIRRKEARETWQKEVMDRFRRELDELMERHGLCMELDDEGRLNCYVV